MIYHPTKISKILFFTPFYCHISKLNSIVTRKWPLLNFSHFCWSFDSPAWHIHGIDSNSIIFSHRDESWMDLIQFCYLFFAVRLETLKRRLCNVMSGDIVELKAMMAVSSPTKKGHKENGNHNHGVESSKVGFLQLWCFQAWQAKLWILWFTTHCYFSIF